MTDSERIMPNVLLAVADRSSVRLALEVLSARSIRCTVQNDPRQACLQAEEPHWDMLMVDAQQDGAMEMLALSKTHFPERPVVMIGQADALLAAVAAMRAGCDDYLVKPLKVEQLRQLAAHILPNRNVEVAASAGEGLRCLFQLAGRSKLFLDTLALARKVAPTSMPVLISGESGTGKELVSYLIHRHSARRRGPYIRVNCAALSETLLESELFGHERGAFTGAHMQRKGRFERAHGGTLLLDEISETGPRLQAELLRVLEQQDFERVGGSEVIQVNVRVICTSNKNLLEEVAKGLFRRDLYYRISGLHLRTPPLRERHDDVEVLAWHFINQFSREVRRAITSIDPASLEVLARCDWPGNIRQLRNVVRTALVMGSGPVLSLDDAPFLIDELTQVHPQGAAATRPVGQKACSAADLPTIDELGAGRAGSPPTTLSLQELERRAILEALDRSQRNQAKAARLLGITDRTLREKLRRYREDGKLQPAGEMAW